MCPEGKKEMESLKCDKGLQCEILNKEQSRVTRNPKEAGMSDLHVQKKTVIGENRTDCFLSWFAKCRGKQESPVFYVLQ